ncbi:MAG: hypothetical protein ACD_71C00173G0002 [uncultured bacterium (gcode 4)]|uniref:Glycerophosphoryl diester phosphodiesterase membrane domain-containing protein n=1 Tax=uncultured bacterium (gcode 4) TaxID=1234023 RepID=K1Z467_9BACT|nr:MAG: hypothetical protein ACD_71C00173G0002 [uncultured bacterium (gcode 4)]
MFASYLSNLKHIGQDILLLYRNFIHWNLSKILIYLYANIAGFILSLPFLGIFIYQYITVYNSLMVETDMQTFMMGHFISVLISMLLIIIVVTIFICAYSYSYFLMQNVYKSYLAGEKLPYRDNLYFSWKHIRAYIGILGWISLYLLGPIAVFLIWMLIIGIIAAFNPGLPPFILGSITLVISIGLFIWFVALAIRLAFAYFELLYSENIEKSKTYTDKSLVTTKGKVWKIILLILPFFLVIWLFAGLIGWGDAFLKAHPIYETLFVIFSFLVFEGLTSMIYLSVYHILKKS